MGTATRPIAVFDLDGTLSDARHRLHFVAPGRKDWDAFFRAARQDPPLAEGVALAQQWAHECDLGYVTGRPERCREDTELWLAEQGLPSGDLWMRGDGDRRPARVTKPALLERLAARRPVAVVVDDDRAVCAEYRKAGFHVVFADWMPEAAPLRQAQHEGRT
ncbi:phosphatase domain-containing protein [Streptomyces sparsus]